ncbi:UrcA family protein [Sphingomonas sp. 2R-10]|uniref:UrcA family protein n=1 Tax=Sphingomonas sp. 2R-10 TaxID=3045148 RepID=UPI000F766902|nr:UrcA family protein [Sphingomonas sp. 2R-10]MDJ0275683.1 UrcA family protein [Sphingomonas sp. 2R-10]
MTIRLIALAATVAACLSPVAHAEEREPVTVRVSYAGLDLATVEGRRTLDSRIDRAARGACRSRVPGFRGQSDERRCRTEMASDAQVRVAQLKPVAVASAR